MYSSFSGSKLKSIFQTVNIIFNVGKSGLSISYPDVLVQLLLGEGGAGLRGEWGEE